MLRELGFAIRSLRRTPGFALLAVLTLGLGIGANTSMFSILNGYLFAPLPYPEGDRLDRVYRATPQNRRGGISPPDYLALKAEAGAYGDVSVYDGLDLSLSEPGRPPVTAEGLRVSANLFSTLGVVSPLLGRGFTPDEETAGNHHVLVLSHRYWQSHFGGDPGIVGRTVRVNGDPHEIIGVLPAGFSDWRHLTWVDAFRPLGLEAAEARDSNATWLRVIARRAPGVSRERGHAFFADFGRRRAAEFPAANVEASWSSVPLHETLLARDGQAVVALLVGLSGFVLLIACSNLANLLLARTMARAREFAVRAALGASRRRVLRPLVLECLLLALAGGGLALIVARWTFDWFAIVSRGDSGVGVDLRLDWNVLGWALAACLFTAVAFGVVPALFAQRLDLVATLKSGGRGATADRGHRRFRHALIVGQFALAMVLLAGAALFARGLYDLNNRREGWESDGLVTATLQLPPAAYPGGEAMADFERRALERVEALPGVASASFSYTLPFFGLSETRRYRIAGRALERGHEPAALVNGVSPRYFETVGTRLVAGRVFDARDALGAPRVYVVSRAFARGLFGDASAVGQRIAPAEAEPPDWGEIVGVVADALTVYPDSREPTHQVYQPLAQQARRSLDLAVRTANAPPAALGDGIRGAMMSLDPDLPLRGLQPAETAITRANYQLGVLRSVLSALGVLGLSLAALGIYGVIARSVAQRTGEFGIRLALGARDADITGLVLGSAAKLAAVGGAIGLLGAWGVARIIAGAFPGIPMGSFAVLGGVTLLLAVVALVASYLPARRATRIDPAETLRTE